MYVEKRRGGRDIVVEKDRQQYLSPTGKCYDDGEWKVTLYTGRNFGKHIDETENVAITLRSQPQQRTQMKFSSGKLTLMVNEIGGMDVYCYEYDEMLNQYYDIPDGRVVRDPNGRFNCQQELERKLFRIVTDGELECWGDDENINLKPDDKTSRLEPYQNVAYRIRDAKWAVVCQVDLDDPIAKSVQLWTLESNIDRIAERLETFLDQREGIKHFSEYAVL